MEPGRVIRYQRGCRHVSILLSSHTCQTCFHTSGGKASLPLPSLGVQVQSAFPSQQSLGNHPCMCSFRHKAGLLTACGTPEWCPDGPYTKEIPGANLDHPEETASPACLPQQFSLRSACPTRCPAGLQCQTPALVEGRP